MVVATETTALMPDGPTINNVDNSSGSGNERKYKFSFQDHLLRFESEYPAELGDRLRPDEFNAVMDKIHNEFGAELAGSHATVRKWSIICAATSVVLVGLFLSPVLATRVNRQQKLMQKFWKDLRVYFQQINKETFFKRGFEWKVVDDVEKRLERDAYNKLYCFRIELKVRKMRSMANGNGLRTEEGEEVVEDGGAGVRGSMNSHDSGAGLVGVGAVVGGTAAGAAATGSFTRRRKKTTSSVIEVPEDALTEPLEPSITAIPEHPGQEEGEEPIALYSRQDPFTALYETDRLVPVGAPAPDADVDVLADDELGRAKKYRVEPDSEAARAAEAISRTTVTPRSKRSNYLPELSSSRENLFE